MILWIYMFWRGCRFYSNYDNSNFQLRPSKSQLRPFNSQLRPSNSQLRYSDFFQIKMRKILSFFYLWKDIGVDLFLYQFLLKTKAKKTEVVYCTIERIYVYG